MNALIACHDCDLVHHKKTLPAKGAAHCIRCGAVLYKHKPNSLERTEFKARRIIDKRDLYDEILQHE